MQINSYVHGFPPQNLYLFCIESCKTSYTVEFKWVTLGLNGQTIAGSIQNSLVVILPLLVAVKLYSEVIIFKGSEFVV